MISVITPSFNQGKYIERTIQSVLSQSIPNLEYVVMDGGSQDDTVSILERYSNQLSYVSEPDNGQAHAVNKGIMQTSGDIIGWLNSDDVYFPNAIQTVLDFFEKHPDVDIIYGNAHHIDQDGGFIEVYPAEPWNIERLKQTCFFCQPAVFFRRSVFDRFGLLNEKLNYCLDYEFWLRIALKGAKFSYLPTILAGSRLYPETKTLSAPVKAQHEAMQMLHDHLGYVPVNWLLGYAVMRVKEKTNLRKPQPRFALAVFFEAACAAFRWNGVIKGFQSCCMLPMGMLNLLRGKR